ncbi:hypothetical protein J2T08_001711 [Neorhizobium galegae]|uniref:hypothetical protein n=1 Tax=Neorhizobium galegae TaxID=399 RepID=UPI001AE4DA99|nr:hypothetical protein [Neorhizobium galegae]MBP2562222.1 hypothetical protein [Neorhizobium galegae]MDQ0133793.1 hypothetical protein [Neorhizobium galegae]
MSLLIYTTDASADLVDYIDSYIAAVPSLGTPGRYGSFNPTTAPYDQWYQGNNSSAYTAVLDGDFTSYTQGNLTGTADTFEFGYGLTSSGGLYSVTEVELTFDFRDLNVNPQDSFDYLVYGFVSANSSYVYDYFDDVGTIQVGTSANNTLAGFDSTDYFYFEANWGTDVINDFTDGEDYIVLDSDVWANFAAFDAVADISGNTVTLGGNTITLAGFAGSLTSADFQFVADPSTIA